VAEGAEEAAAARRAFIRRGSKVNLERDYEESSMKRCPICGSKEIFECTKDYRYSGCGEEVLPKLAPGLFTAAKIRPTVCVDCGHIGLFASEAARTKAKESAHWRPIGRE
jgi:hypothetical protein